MNARLTQVADEMGVPYAPPERAPNTRKALALSEFARRQDKLTEWRAAAMDAHWRDGRDLEDPEVLADLLTQSGLDAQEGLAFLDDPEVPAILEAQRVEAHRWGVNSVPTWFMLPDGWKPGEPWPEQGPQPLRVVGCQPLEVVCQAALQAGAKPR